MHLTREHIDAYADHLRAEERSPSTIATVRERKATP